MNTGMSRLVTSSKKRPGFLVVRIGALMAGIDEHASELVAGDRTFELLEKSIAAARERAGEGDDSIGLRVLDLGEIPV